MTCEEAGPLIQDKVDGLISRPDAERLRRHLDGCPPCRAQLAGLLAIDAALAGSGVAQAPRWLPGAVTAEISRRAAVRRNVERVAIGLGAPAAVVAAGTALRVLTAPPGGPGVGERLAHAFTRTSEPLSETISSLMRAPGLSTSWSESPGVQGVVLALAAASLILLSIVALRLSRQLTLEWR